MRFAIWRRSFSHTALHCDNKSSKLHQDHVPTLIQAARDRIESNSRNQSSALTPADQWRLPPLPPPPSESVPHEPPQAAILPRFRRDVPHAARGILAQTAYSESIMDEIKNSTHHERKQAFLAKLPLFIQSCSERFWRAATSDDLAIRHASLELVQRCLKARDKDLAKAVVRRKIELDGLNSVSSDIWVALGAQVSLLRTWLDRIQSLSSVRQAQEKALWLQCWKLAKVDNIVPYRKDLYESVRALDIARMKQSLDISYEPFQWHPLMSPSIVRWLDLQRRKAESLKRPTDSILRLSSTVKQLYPPPNDVPIPQTPPTVERLQELQRAYEVNDVKYARSILAQLAQSEQLQLPPKYWRIVRVNDPSIIIWSALRYFLTLKDLTPEERQAWTSLYRSVHGPAMPAVRANTQSGLLADRIVRDWLDGNALQQEAQERLDQWAQQEFGPGVTEWDGKRAKAFLQLCRSRYDLRESISTMLTTLAHMPMKHKQRWQMSVLHTLLAVNYKSEPTRVLVNRLEAYMRDVWDYDAATTDFQPRLDSGVLRPLWLSLEHRVPIFDHYRGLLHRALFFIEPEHPYLGPKIARGMPDAPAILTRLASKEIQHYNARNLPERAKKVEQKLKQVLESLELQFTSSRTEEKDEYRVLKGSMERARKANLDWSDTFKVKQSAHAKH